MSTAKDKVIELCKLHNISLHKLETDLGFGNSTIRKWDKTQPRIDKLKAVADYFKIDVSEIAVYNSVTQQIKDEIAPSLDEIEFSLYDGLNQLDTKQKRERVAEIMKNLLNALKEDEKS